MAKIASEKANELTLVELVVTSRDWWSLLNKAFWQSQTLLGWSMTAERLLF